MKNTQTILDSDTPLTALLKQIFSIMGCSLTKIAAQCGADRSIPYAWLKHKSKPSTKNIIQLGILVGSRTMNVVDEITGQRKTQAWWIASLLEAKGVSVSEKVLAETISAISTGGLTGSVYESKVIISLVEKRALLKSLMCLHEEVVDLAYIESYPEVADRILTAQISDSHHDGKIASWHKTNSGEMTYLFAGNDVSTEELYKWMGSFAEKVLNEKQTINLFVAPANNLSEDEFCLLKDLYAFWFSRLSDWIKCRLRVYLSSKTVPCPVSVLVLSGSEPAKYIELHGLASAVEVLAPLYVAKKSKGDMYQTIYSLTTLKTEMNGATARLLLRENGIVHSDETSGLVPTSDKWVSICV